MVELIIISTLIGMGPSHAASVSTHSATFSSMERCQEARTKITGYYNVAGSRTLTVTTFCAKRLIMESIVCNLGVRKFFILW